MYTPEVFKEERVPVLHDAIRRTGLATLVTAGARGLVANHLPMLLEAEAGPLGTLHGHLARANDQWRDLAGGGALAVFLGPGGYVTPSWYATKAETGKVVPTWNYVAVHAYGPVEVYDDKDRLLALVTRLTETHEAHRREPWQVADAPERYVRGLLGAIVGLEMRIERLEGKWKLSQNRPETDRQGVVQGFSSEAGDAGRVVAEAMTEAAGRSRE
jgi:transcriptional regulator